MRWKEPNHGDIKIKKKFALFPITIGGETRWLEWVKIKYVYHSGIFRDPKDYYNYCYYDGWRVVKFIDEE